MRGCLISLFLLLLAACPAVGQDSLQQLINDDRLTVRAWLDPEGDIVATQRVNLRVEVATERFLAGGTRIGRLDIRDAVVFQQSGLATNASRRVGGATWSVQTWTLPVFPQFAGFYEVPATGVTITVASDDPANPITGTVTLPALRFEAAVPPPLAAAEGWVATSRFTVDESYDRSLEGLAPGDALRRTIRIRATNIPAMMLPAFEPAAEQGLAAYVGPPQLRDSRNRGAVNGERIETITYVVEAAGSYSLPERRYQWWDLPAGRVREIILPAQEFVTVGGSAAPVDQPAAAAPEPEIDWRTMLRWAAIGIVAAAALWLALRLRHRFITWREARQRSLPGKAVLAHTVAGTVGTGEQRVAAFYQMMDRFGPDDFDGSVRDYDPDTGDSEPMEEFETLMKVTYGRERGWPKVGARIFGLLYASKKRPSKRSELLF